MTSRVRRGAKTVLTAAILCGIAATIAAAERDLFDVSNRFLEGDRSKVEPVPSVLRVESFEIEATLARDWRGRGVAVEQRTEHATEGDHSMKATFADSRSQLAYLRASWDGFPFIRQLNFFDELRFDVFNPGEPVRLSVRMINVFRFDLKTGHNEIRIGTRDMKRDRLVHFNLNPDGIFTVDAPGKDVVLYFDNLRWIGPGLGPNLLQHARRFDFGPVQWCRPQFLPVAQGTGYDGERGYGWVTPHVPKHKYDQRQSATFTYNPADDLVGDMIHGMTSPFRIDLPGGKYRMHLVEGHVGYLDPQVSYWDLGVRIDGVEPVTLRRGARTFEEFVRFEYGRDRVDYAPGDDRWQDYMACRHRVLEHDFEVTGDHVTLEFTSDPPGMAQIAFMIVYPLEKTNVIEPELAAMWHDIRERFNDHAFGFIPRQTAQRLDVPGFHVEYLDTDVRKRRLEALKVTQGEIDHGFVIFHREPVDEVFPDTVPSPEERAAKVTALGPPGEIETLTVSLFALKDLKDVRLELLDFAGPGGSVIPARCADVRVVNCTYEMTARESHGDWSFIPKPRWLVKRDRVDVPRMTCRRFWINVDIPVDTPPGKYVARGTVKAPNADETHVALELEVLPFTLAPVPKGVEHSINITYPYHPIIDRELPVFLRRHPALMKDEKWKALQAEAQKAHAARIEAEFNLIRRYGFRKVYMDANYVENVPLTPETRHGVEVVRYTQKSSSAILSEGRAFLALPDFTEAKIAESLAAGKRTVLLRRGADSIMPLWYPDQEGGVSRFQAGLFLWRSGNRAHMEWGWSRHLGDRYTPFCSEPGLYWGLIAPASRDWPTFNTSVVLEGAREGIKDHRYLATLHALIEKHKDTPSAKEAEAYLANLRKRIQPALSRYLHRVGSGGFGGGYWTYSETADAWRGTDYLRERRAMTKLIAKLSE